MKKNVIILIMAPILSCLCIPAGRWHDLSCLEIVANMIVFIVAIFIVGLNNEGFFKPTPERKMGHYILANFIFYAGFMTLLGSFGLAYWLRAAGGVLLIAGAFYMRRISSNNSK